MGLKAVDLKMALLGCYSSFLFQPSSQRVTRALYGLDHSENHGRVEPRQHWLTKYASLDALGSRQRLVIECFGRILPLSTSNATWFPKSVESRGKLVLP